MRDLDLCAEIIAAQNNESALVNLILRFKPLLNKYAIKLMYEDAYSDLQLDFIEMVYKLKIENMKRTDGIKFSY